MCRWFDSAPGHQYLCASAPLSGPGAFLQVDRYFYKVNITVRFQFRNLVRALQADAAVAGGIEDAVTVGSLREAVVKRFLRPHLPETISILSGIIIDSNGNKSRQQDIVLVDRSFPTISVGSEGVALIVAESVLATIEVKSCLDSAALHTTLESIAVTRSLRRSGEIFYSKRGCELRTRMLPILAYVVAFEGATLPMLTTRMGEFCASRQDGGIGPEAILVLSRGVILRESLMVTVRADPSDRVNSIAKLPPVMRQVECKAYELKQDGLLKFYSRLRDDVCDLKIISYDLDPYFDVEEGE